MLIALIGESCVGKSTIANEITKVLHAEIFSGKDYLRLAKSEAEAKAAFTARLAERAASKSEHAVYVISEQDQLSLLPETCTRVVVTAGLETIKTRFASRMGGKLPPPVEAMLVKKHGMFDSIPNDLSICSDETPPSVSATQILLLLNK
jgi:ABC-type glutathione transport system ATPase component